MTDTNEDQIVVDPEPEQVDNSAAVEAKKAEVRRKNREKKAAQRKRDKAKKQLKEAEKFEASLETMDNVEFWKLNTVKDLTPKQLAEYTERDAEVLALEIQMENVVFQNLERVNDSQYRELRDELHGLNIWEPRELSIHEIQNLKAQVQADLEKHGTRLGGLEGLNLAQHRACFDQWSAGDQHHTRAYALYGFCLAIDSSLLIAFQQATAEGGYVLRCQCGKTQRFKNSEPRPESVWHCFDCVERTRKQADVTAQLDAIRQKAIQAPDKLPFDQYGRPFDGSKL